jgi:O-antigen ligase
MTFALKRQVLAPALVGGWAAAIALAPDLTSKLVIGGPPVAIALAWWTLLSPERWLGLFFFCAILLPPLPGAFGNAGLNLAPAFALAGIFVGIMRITEWRPMRGPLPVAFFVFLTIVTGSVGFAVLYSGWAIAAGSLARVMLLAVAVWIFFYTLAGTRGRDADPMRFARWLFLASAVAALFACVDFYFQLPAPAGYGAQFIWVGEDMLRRAQGLFYEASTLGNFCAFFLVMILVAAFRPSQERPCSRIALGAGGVLFAAALLLSYSRASLVTIAVAGFAFVCVRRMNIRRAFLVICGSMLCAALLFRIAMPELSSHYWNRIELSLQYLWSSPDGVLSGRLSVWKTIADALIRQPWQAVFGIGYKTLPYTGIVGPNLPADNTYLSLLVETGVVGLAAFLFLNAAILRTSFHASRSTRPRASFFGTWIFCFWCGEMVQMLSGDLITYWRVLPVYFWVLATAARESAE